MRASISLSGALAVLLLPGIIFAQPNIVAKYRAPQGSSWTALAFSPDGRTVAAGSDDATVRLWDVASGTQRATLEGHTQVVKSTAFSYDGKFIVSASHDQTVKVWEGATAKEVATLRGEDGKQWFATFSPDGKLIASAGSSQIRLWDTATYNVITKLESAQCLSVAFSPDGKSLVSGHMDFQVRLWDVANGMERNVIKGHGLWVWSVVFAPNGATIASAGGDRKIKLWDVATGAEQVSLEGYGPEEYSLSFSADGKVLASGGGDDVKVWDLATGKVISTLPKAGRVWPASFNPRGGTIATARADEIKIWELTSDK